MARKKKIEENQIVNEEQPIVEEIQPVELPLHKQRIPPEIIPFESFFISKKNSDPRVKSEHLATIRAFVMANGGKPKDSRENYERIIKMYFGS